MQAHVSLVLRNRVIGRIPLGQAGLLTRLAESLGRRVFLDSAGLALHIESAVDGRTVAIDPAPDGESFGLARTVAGILAAIGARTVILRGAHEWPSGRERRRRVRCAAADLVLHLRCGSPQAAYPVWPPARSRRAATLLARTVGAPLPRARFADGVGTGSRPAAWLSARDPAAVCRGVVLFFRSRQEPAADASPDVDLPWEFPLCPVEAAGSGGDAAMPGSGDGPETPVFWPAVPRATGLPSGAATTPGREPGGAAEAEPGDAAEAEPGAGPRPAAPEPGTVEDVPSPAATAGGPAVARTADEARSPAAAGVPALDPAARTPWAAMPWPWPQRQADGPVFQPRSHVFRASSAGLPPMVLDDGAGSPTGGPADRADNCGDLVPFR